MAYKTRSGVVLIKVCDAPILVATREIWADYPMIRPLSKLGAVVWSFLVKDHSWNRILYICSALTRSTQKEIEPKLKSLCDSLVKDGFLIEIPDEGDEHDEV